METISAVRTLLIDDEKPARRALRTILEMRCPEVDIIGEADSVPTGLQAIRELQPDLVLLDIMLKDQTGFDLLKQLPEIDFKLIFITAHEDFAIRAFRYSALDYILKPVDSTELVAAIAKVREVLGVDDLRLRLSTLMENMAVREKPRKIALRSVERINIVDLHEIVRCASERNYTRFFLADGSSLLVSRTMKDYADLLEQSGFFRVHHSHLINLEHLVAYEKADGGFVTLSDNSSVPVANRRKDQLLRYLDRLF